MFTLPKVTSRRDTPVATSFTRRNPNPRPRRFLWLVLVGNQCVEYWLELATPSEELVRQLLGIPEDVPIEIGRP
jgi:hypothetical protein